MTHGVTRRSEILDAAAVVLARDGVRAPLQTIADACGIRPSSLYHHFDSKEALIVELLERFHAELEDVADTVTDAWVTGEGGRKALVDFGVAVTDVARRHLAAMAFAYIEPPAHAGDELRKLAGAMPAAVDRAIGSLLATGRSRHGFRPDIDVALLGAQFCQVMLQSAISSPPASSLGPAISRMKCEIVLDGSVSPSRRTGSTAWGPAHRAADEVIASWGRARDDRGNRAALIRRVAGEEFAKRGVELTRVSDVAAAAGIDKRAVYRVVSSKEELIESVVSTYVSHVDDGWRQVVAGPGQPEERLDALLWLTINARRRFGPEHRTLALAVQQGSPATADARERFQRHVGKLAELLADGDTTGAFNFAGHPRDLRSAAIFSMMFPAANLVQRLAPQACLALARDLITHGISVTHGISEPRDSA